MWPTVKAHVFFVKKPEFTLTAMLSPNNIACFFLFLKFFMVGTSIFNIILYSPFYGKQVYEDRQLPPKIMRIDNFALWE